MKWRNTIVGVAVAGIAIAVATAEEPWMKGRMADLQSGLANMETKWSSLNGDMAAAQAKTAWISAQIAALNLQQKWNSGSTTVKTGANVAAGDDKDALRQALDAGASYLDNKKNNNGIDQQKNDLLNQLRQASQDYENAKNQANELAGQISVVKDSIRSLNTQMGKNPDDGLPPPRDRDTGDMIKSPYDPGDTDRSNLRPNQNNRPSGSSLRPPSNPRGDNCGKHM